MDQSYSILKTGRDGLLIATLSTGVNTTICNYKFGDLEANVACLTLGYPAKGTSIVNPNSTQTGSVLLGDIRCTGTETNLNLCISSGIKAFGTPCSSHNLDTYIYCLHSKVAPQIPTKVVNTTCKTTNGLYGFVPLPNKTNTGFLTYSGRYVCNKNYAITGSDMKSLCEKFCTDVSNPLLNMPNSGPPLDSTYVQMSGPAYIGTNIPACNPNTYVVAMQCGPEPVIIEPSPNVTCTSRNITATWSVNTIPHINSTLISLAMSCSSSSYSILSDNFKAVIINIDFFLCDSILSSTPTTISYSYVLTRSYSTIGITSTAPRNLTISCVFPKDDSSKGNISIATQMPVYLNSSATIPLQMVFYTDRTYSTAMTLPYSIYDNMLMYVKVSLISTVNTLSLGLVNCKMSTVNTMEATDAINSASLITNSCPSDNKDYKVSIYPLTRKDFGFVFQPFKINGNASIYVLCETTKCYMDTTDGNCLICTKPNSRRKRSVMVLETIVKGPLNILNSN